LTLPHSPSVIPFPSLSLLPYINPPSLSLSSLSLSCPSSSSLLLYIKEEEGGGRMSEGGENEGEFI